MDGIKRTSKQGTAKRATSVHQHAQKSTTLNRKFVKKPVAKPQIKKSATNASQALLRRQLELQKRREIQAERRRTLNKQGVVKLQPSADFVKQQAQLRNGKILQKVGGEVIRKTDAQQNVATQQQKVIRRSVRGCANAQQNKLSQIRSAAQGDLAQIKAHQKTQESIQRSELEKVARARMAARNAEAPQIMSMKERKDRAIQQSLHQMAVQEKNTGFEPNAEEKKGFFKNRKLIAAGVLAVVSIALLGYFVSLNLPDISVRVAASQAGIEDAYPSYVPLNYRLDGLVKEENGRITMNFKNDEGQTFMLTEEKSSWDSAGLLSNYVKKEWGSDYSIAKGQGLTIYISDSKATWVNGGVKYLIEAEDDVLSSEDLHDIAVSL